MQLWRWAPDVWGPLMLASMIVSGIHPVVPQLLMAVLVVSCTIREDHALAPLLGSRPLAYLGTISYGLYMLHMLGKNLAFKLLGLAGVAVAQLPAVALFGATTAITIVAAGLSFRYYETYFLSLKNRHQR